MLPATVMKKNMTMDRNLEQMSREPRPMPQLHIADKPFDKLTIDDFVVENYDPHPPIRRSMAV
jgi:thymidylate synthase